MLEKSYTGAIYAARQLLISII